MSFSDCLWGLAAIALVGCAADDALVPDALENDLNFEYMLDGDMAIAMPRSGEIFIASGGTGPSTVFLNFEGVTVNKAGWAQNNAQLNSSFVPKANSTIPAFDASHWPGAREQVIAEIVAGVASDYADYTVEFTATRPAQSPYTMIIIGGVAADIGIDANILGVAPLDSTNWNPNDVGFVFSDVAGQFGYTARELAHTVSHELGHTLGLRHITRPTDIMQPAACHCGQDFGAGPLIDDPAFTQDSHLILSSIFPAGASPIGSLVSINASGMATGWACDPDDPTDPLTVQLFVGGIAGSGAALHSTVANLSSGSGPNNLCGGGTSHGFSIALPAGECNQPVHVYGVNASDTPGSTSELSDSPKTMPACSSGGGGAPNEPLTCGASNAWIEQGTHATGSVCGKTCSGYHWSWCDYNGDGATDDGWQFCLPSGWASCSFHKH